MAKKTKASHIRAGFDLFFFESGNQIIIQSGHMFNSQSIRLNHRFFFLVQFLKFFGHRVHPLEGIDGHLGADRFGQHEDITWFGMNRDKGIFFGRYGTAANHGEGIFDTLAPSHRGSGFFARVYKSSHHLTSDNVLLVHIHFLRDAQYLRIKFIANQSILPLTQYRFKRRPWRIGH